MENVRKGKEKKKHPKQRLVSSVLWSGRSHYSVEAARKGEQGGPLQKLNNLILFLPLNFIYKKCFLNFLFCFGL